MLIGSFPLLRTSKNKFKIPMFGVLYFWLKKKRFSFNCTAVTHCHLQDWCIDRNVGLAFVFPAAISPCGVPPIWPSSLTLWPPRICLNLRNRLQSSGETFPWHNHTASIGFFVAWYKIYTLTLVNKELIFSAVCDWTLFQISFLWNNLIKGYSHL